MPTLFLSGDVMTGRGIDQILAYPCPPGIQEPYVRDARDYVALAEEVNGLIAHPVAPAYIWGDALAELERVAPDARIINLETSITTCDDFWPGKGIHYRMHPRNVDCLTAAAVDVCVLANNHVLDYGRAGLDQTIATLIEAGLKVAGAGASIHQAREPAIVDLSADGRILVFAAGAENSGIPKTWEASAGSSGVDLLPDLSDATADDLLNRVRGRKRQGDVAVVSIHWGDNWGYEVPDAHVRFAHRLLDGGVDLIHGHSSHHPRPVEIYRDRLVLYGCGDFITDYEGITGYEEFRDDLVLMYFPHIDPGTGELVDLRMTPLQIRNMQLIRPPVRDRDWLRERLANVSRNVGCDVTIAPDDSALEVRRLMPCHATVWPAIARSNNSRARRRSNARRPDSRELDGSMEVQRQPRGKPTCHDRSPLSAALSAHRRCQSNARPTASRTAMGESVAGRFAQHATTRSNCDLPVHSRRLRWMFERYTESARRTLFYARYEASQVGGTSIEPEHVLLGMVKEPGPLVGRIFAAAEISHRAIWQELDAQKTLPKLPTSVEMPFSEDTKRVLQYAADEASGLAHGHVAVAHLLLGLLRERGSLAERYLAKRGISVDRVREQIRVEEATPAADSTSGPTPSEALVALARVSSLLDQIRQSCRADVAQLIEGIEVELQLVERALVRDK